MKSLNPMKMIKAEKESNKKMIKSEISIDLYLCEIGIFDENQFKRNRRVHLIFLSKKTLVQKL